MRDCRGQYVGYLCIQQFLPPRDEIKWRDAYRGSFGHGALLNTSNPCEDHPAVSGRIAKWIMGVEASTCPALLNCDYRQMELPLVQQGVTHGHQVGALDLEHSALPDSLRCMVVSPHQYLAHLMGDKVHLLTPSDKMSLFPTLVPEMNFQKTILSLGIQADYDRPIVCATA